jgi:hypothetical protein
MNVRRGLFRLWIVLAVLWIGFMLATGNYDCFYGSKGPWCDYWTAETYIKKVAGVFGPPLAILILGWVGFWVASGFKADKS